MRFFYPILIFSLVCATGRGLPDCTEEITAFEEDMPGFTWEGFAEEWLTSVEKTLSRDTELVPSSLEVASTIKALTPYYMAAVEREDSRIAGMEFLGLDFSQVAQGRITVPSLFKVIERFNDEVDFWVATQQIKETETLRPGVALRAKDGQIWIARFGTPLPEKFELIDVSLQPSLFTKMIKLGILPITVNSRAHHDLNHMRGMLALPRYMTHIRATAEDFSRHGHPIPIRDRYLRFFHLYEAMALLPPEQRGPLHQHLTAPHLSPQELYEQLIKDPPALTSARASHLIAFAQQNLIFLGGAAEIGMPYSNTELFDSLPRLLYLTKRLLERHRSAETADKKGRLYTLLCLRLSRLEPALQYAARVGLDEYFAETRNPQPNPNSLLMQWYQVDNLTFSEVPPLFALSLSGRLGPSDERYFSSQFRALQRE